jgi:hypothetical protein
MVRKASIRKFLPAGLVSGAIGIALLLPAGAIATALAGYTGYGYSFGGILKGGPAATGTATTEEIFVRGQDNAIWSTQATGNTASWTSRGGLTVAPPGATATDAVNTDAFVEGVDAQLWTIKETSGAFGTWKTLGGIITAGPGATNGFVAGREDLFVRGGDRGVWWSVSTDAGATWNPGVGTVAGKFAAVGGISVDSIAAVSPPGGGSLDIYVWGQDNALWWRQYTAANGWTAWTSLGGKTIYAPAATSCSAGHLDIWVVGVDGQLWQRSSIDNGVSWGTWNQWGGQWTSNLTAFCHPGTTNVDVFGRGSDAALWRFKVQGA